MDITITTHKCPPVFQHRGAFACYGLVLAAFEELFIKPLAEVVRHHTCCDGQHEGCYLIHEYHLLPAARR